MTCISQKYWQHQCLAEAPLSAGKVVDDDAKGSYFLVLALVGCPYSEGAVHRLTGLGRKMRVKWVRRGGEPEFGETVQ
jgi:hypothetical protein